MSPAERVIEQALASPAINPILRMIRKFRTKRKCTLTVTTEVIPTN